MLAVVQTVRNERAGFSSYRLALNAYSWIVVGGSTVVYGTAIFKKIEPAGGMGVDALAPSTQMPGVPRFGLSGCRSRGQRRDPSSGEIFRAGMFSPFPHTCLCLAFALLILDLEREGILRHSARISRPTGERG
jgi:hypothetical protein